MKPVIQTIVLMAGFTAVALAEPPAKSDGNFADWEGIPEIINSITDESRQPALDQLHQLTHLKLGSPQAPDLEPNEQKQYMLETKQRWLTWWEGTGKPVAAARKEHAKVDAEAFDLVWAFLNPKKVNPKKAKPGGILPVWIPSTWTLQVTFTNGDYGGREKELWVMTRTDSEAHLFKLRGSYGEGSIGHDGWTVKLEEYNEFTTATADRILKAICYLNAYATAAEAQAAENEMKRLYYPYAEIRLMDGDAHWLWNTEGYEFTKSVTKYGNGPPGRTYYFLRSTFSNPEMWTTLSKPTDGQFRPFRAVLNDSKPYFSSLTSELVQLFGECGGVNEIRSMLDWAEKQKAATDPDLQWRFRSDEFGSSGKENVVNFTRTEIRKTFEHAGKGLLRLEDQADTKPAKKDLERLKNKLNELERFIVDMTYREKMEEEDEIHSFPQPLRELVRVDRQQGDPDLDHLTAAIQKIRDNPDPKLFRQLAEQLDDPTVRMNSLMNHILINEHGLLKLKAWDSKQLAIATEACIDAIPHIKQRAREDLIIILLQVFGGGALEIQEADGGGRSIKVSITESGHSYTLGGATNPLSVAKAQDKLRELDKKSREKH